MTGNTLIWFWRRAIAHPQDGIPVFLVLVVCQEINRQEWNYENTFKFRIFAEQRQLFPCLFKSLPCHSERIEESIRP
jgi:hypothetical protein